VPVRVTEADLAIRPDELETDLKALLAGH